MATYVQQYADGTSNASTAGTIMMGDDTTNLQFVHVDTSGDLQVDVLTMPTTTITGTVDTELPAAAALADGASATPTTPTVGVIALLMNATTVDRQRAVVAGLDSTGTGIAAAGLVGQFDDAATATVTENQFAPVRISSRRAVLLEGVGTAGSSLGGVVSIQGVASGTAVPISGSITASPSTGATATLTNVNDTASSTTLLAANANRLTATIYNDSPSLLYVKFGTTASTTSFNVRIGAQGFYEIPVPTYTGRIDGIWSADASGAARIMELTA